MRRNAAGQLVTAILRTTSATVAAVATGATMTVVKDGTMSAGAGTLTYIGTGTPIGSTAGAVTGVWKYAPTAGETNASSVSFIFGSATANTVVVEKLFEPTSGPILYQALLSATGGAVTNQTTIVLPSATPIPAADDNAYNGCEIVFYDGSTSGQVSVGVVLDYVGSTRTITLREAPTFTVTTSDYITIIANQGLKSAVKDMNASVDADGRVDVIKIAGTTQTARDIGASVLLSSGTGTGQLDFTSGVVKANATQLLGTAWLTPGTAGTPDVNAKLIGATAQTGRDIGASVLLSSGTGTGQLSITSGIAKVDVDTIKTNPVVNAGTITFPTTATLASTTNITAGTIATATAVTTVNGLGAGVITAASIAADAITDAKVASDVTVASVTGAVGSVTGAVGSVTGNVGGNVTGSVGSLAAQAKADVNAEVLDVLSTDTFGEPTGVPGATLTLREKIGWLFMALRNKITVTATKKTFFDDGDAAEWEKDVSDDGTTYTETEGNAV